jgi:hypothetical protein
MYHVNGGGGRASLEGHGATRPEILEPRRQIHRFLLRVCGSVCEGVCLYACACHGFCGSLCYVCVDMYLFVCFYSCSYSPFLALCLSTRTGGTCAAR